MRRKRLLISSIIISIVLIMIVIFAIAMRDSAPQQTMAVKEQAKISTPALSPLKHPKPKTTQTSATLAAVGDVLIHEKVYKEAKTAKGYDFKPMFAKVKPYIQKADIAVANQESMIGGTKIGLSTYPAFNSPYAVGDALKDAGFDMITMANNHTLDRGIPAIQNAIHHWDQINMPHTGSFLSAKDRNTINTLKRNDIVFSFLAYTYGTNGIPVPKGKDYLVNYIDLPLMKKDIKKAKKKSDVVVVCLHFGTEYERLPNEKQKKLVKQLANEGVDIIIGNHPHVLQPFQWVKGKKGEKTFVAYSLGNFISGQDELFRELAGILQLKVVKTQTGNDVKIKVEQPEFIPTWVDQSDFQIVPLEKAEQYGLPEALSLYDEITAHMRHWIPTVKY